MDGIERVDFIKDVYLMIFFLFVLKIEVIDLRGVLFNKFKMFIYKVVGRFQISYLIGFGFLVMIIDRFSVENLEDVMFSFRGIMYMIIFLEMESLEILLRYRVFVYGVIGIWDEDFLKVEEKMDEYLIEIIKVFFLLVLKIFLEGIYYKLKCVVFFYIFFQEIEEYVELEILDKVIEFILN